MMNRELGDRFTTLVWYTIGALVSVGLCVLFGYLANGEMKKAQATKSD